MLLDFLCISIALISDAHLFAYFCLLFLSLCPCLLAKKMLITLQEASKATKKTGNIGGPDKYISLRLS